MRSVASKGLADRISARIRGKTAFFLTFVAMGLLAPAGPAQAQPVDEHGVSLTLLTRTHAIRGGFAYDTPGVQAMPTFIKVAAAGSRLTRLVVRPMPMLTGEDAVRQAAMAQVVDTAQQAVRAGLSVIVDMHPWPSDTAADEAALVCNAQASQNFQATLVKLAGMLQGVRGGWVALEVLNEPKPCAVGGVVQWPIVQQRYVRAVRAVAPHLPLVVTGTQGQTDGLLNLDVSPYVADPDILFSFHFYEPYIYTTPQYFGLKEVPFPSPGSVAAGGSAYLNYDRSKLTLENSANLLRYLSGQNGPAQIAQRFAQVAQWAAAHHIAPRRLVLGEYGVVGPVVTNSQQSLADAQMWLKAVHTNARNAGFRSIFWYWPTSATPLQDNGNHQLRKDFAIAIGLITR